MAWRPQYVSILWTSLWDEAWHRVAPHQVPVVCSSQTCIAVPSLLIQLNSVILWHLCLSHRISQVGPKTLFCVCSRRLKMSPCSWWAWAVWPTQEITQEQYHAYYFDNRKLFHGLWSWEMGWITGPGAGHIMPLKVWERWHAKPAPAAPHLVLDPAVLSHERQLKYSLQH